MNDTITIYPDLVFEILRYDATEREPYDTYRFFYLEPHAVDSSRSNYRPFATGTLQLRLEDYAKFRELQGPNYCETERHQIHENVAHHFRYLLETEGYTPMSYESLPKYLARFAAHTQAPIEFHQGLDSYDPEVTKRVVVWVRGELPA